MSVARRPLLTATAAGTLLCALWFVPSANATAEAESRQSAGAAATPRSGASASGPGAESVGTVAQGEADGSPLRLADTGAVDTTPYLIAGTAFVCVGAGFVSFAMRRGARSI
ncbi:hypothetical protein V1460_05285 [Streptomyces sp. SCSIO 30461]|uniref:hypothetical protein n=1 Tax=Streptomyces sp. SCSIO 30461 TaxID=3118085 RepID=UPI0030CCA469